jgi:hypothetical protein
MTAIISTTQGPCIERKFGCGSYTAVHRTYPLHLAMIASVRENVEIGESAVVLPWWRRRDAGGRFVSRAGGGSHAG